MYKVNIMEFYTLSKIHWKINFKKKLDVLYRYFSHISNSEKVRYGKIWGGKNQEI